MKAHLPAILLGALLWGLAGSAEAQQVKRPGRPHATTHARGAGAASRTKARAGAYARYSRANRREEENLKLAPGLRLNMPSPPTTDYMGRPLKKKPARSVNSTMSAAEAGKSGGRP